MTIFDIDREILECFDTETGEILDIERLEALEMERDKKIENVVMMYKEAVARGKALREEKQAIDARIKHEDAVAERAKAYIEMATDGKKWQSARGTVTYRKSESVEIRDISEVPEVFIIREPKADKIAIKDALKKGLDVAGAVLVQKVNSIIK